MFEKNALFTLRLTTWEDVDLSVEARGILLVLAAVTQL